MGGKRSYGSPGLHKCPKSLTCPFHRPSSLDPRKSPRFPHRLLAQGNRTHPTSTSGPAKEAAGSPFPLLENNFCTCSLESF